MQLRTKNYSDNNRYLWVDLPSAKSRLQVEDQYFRSDPTLLATFTDQGYVVASNAVDPGAVDVFLTDLESLLEHPGQHIAMTFWDTDGKHQESARREYLDKTEAKVLDLHTRLSSAHRLIFSPVILDFLRDVFEDEPVAFQSLYFEYGSQQGAHQDTAFVYVDPPNHFVASWIALEDVEPGTGELFYYPGSQKLDDIIFASGSKALTGSDPAAASYSRELEGIAAERGLVRTRFLPRRTDVLFWASDLIHGGEPIARRRTRRSLVTHYAPRRSVIPYAQSAGREPSQAAGGGWVIGQN